LPVRFDGRPAAETVMLIRSMRWQTWMARQTRPRLRASEPPLRAELFSVEQLKQHGKALAAEHRIRFGMETTIDRQVVELTEKRAAMKGTVAVKDWDFAMKEMNDARTYLKSMGDEAAKATAETWDQQKAKVGQAWKRAQAAYEKVQLSTTS
jgi:hypothetical protein